MTNPIKKPHIDIAKFSIHAWIRKYGIKNEKGDPIEFHNHLFLYDIYNDPASQIVCMKAAQIGFSTLAIIKNFFDAFNKHMEIIYTLSTDNDAAAFVSGKVDRIVANNPILKEYVAEKDSVERKSIGKSMIYFKGTHTKKAAITTTADRLVHDEKDSSKLDVIAEYRSRLQHSKYKHIHQFSHPSLPGTGIHSDWLQSDQKHWYIKCPHCDLEQYLDWNTEDPRCMSIDFERRAFVCKQCHGIIGDKFRVSGRWIAKYPERKISGYWIPLLVAPWVSATEIIEKYQDPNTTPEFFYTKVLGLPYADGTAKLLREHFVQNLTHKPWAPDQNERIVIGIDTGLKLDYVMGNNNGLFYHGSCGSYAELNRQMKRWPRAIAVIDQGGDLIGCRDFQKRWPGRVFLCSLTGDRLTKELVSWSNGDEYGAVKTDRNRMIQYTIDHFRDKRICVHGTEDDWYEYWLDWNNLAKMKVLDPDTNQIRGYKFVRSGRDHRAMATVFWMVGMSRFAGIGAIFNPKTNMESNSYMINPNATVSFDPLKTIYQMTDIEYSGAIEDSLDANEGVRQDDDWRNI